MEAVKDTVENIIDHSSALAESYYKLSVAKATEKASETAATGTLAMLVAGFVLLILFFTGMGVAWWLGDLLGDRKAGFFVVGGIFLLLLLLLVALRNKTFMPAIRNAVIKSVYGHSHP